MMAEADPRQFSPEDDAQMRAMARLYLEINERIQMLARRGTRKKWLNTIGLLAIIRESYLWLDRVERMTFKDAEVASEFEKASAAFAKLISKAKVLSELLARQLRVNLEVQGESQDENPHLKDCAYGFLGGVAACAAAAETGGLAGLACAVAAAYAADKCTDAIDHYNEQARKDAERDKGDRGR